MSAASRRTEDDVFRILVLADLSGRASRGVRETGRSSLGRRRAREIDRDTFDDVFMSIVPKLSVTVGDGDRTTLLFKSLDDLRPEALAATMPAARSLRDLRARLADPATFQHAVEDARAALGEKETSPGTTLQPAAPDPAESSAASGEHLLDQMFESTERNAARGTDWEAAVRDAVAPEIARIRVPGAAPGQSAWVAAADAALAAVLRRTLRDPGFQSLEAAWRSVFRLVRKTETGPTLKVHVLDVSKDEIAEDVGVSGGFDASGLSKLLVEDTVGVQGGEPWSLVVVDFAFDAVARDVAALLRLTKLARAGEAALVAGAAARVFGCKSLGDTPDAADWLAPPDDHDAALWSALRRVPEASSTALVWPRLLARLPYGERTDPVEGFDFDEMGDGFRHERLVWGGGAFAVAHALAKGFERGGWDVLSNAESDMEGLPAYVRRDAEGDEVLQPCAEALISSRAAETISDRGAIPLLSVRGDATGRLGGLHSIAAQPTDLVGPWS